MKKPKFRYVAQEHKSGCAIACIAMITGERYDEVASKFVTNLEDKGIDTEITVNYLINKNLSPVSLHLDRVSLETKTIYYKILYKPFADIHIVRVFPWADDVNNVTHAIIMDSKGKIFDPDRPSNKSLKDYYEVLQILGFYYER